MTAKRTKKSESRRVEGGAAVTVLLQPDNTA